MPRKAKAKVTGGYAQRTDLAQAAKAPTNMAYGAHQETIEAQKAMPLPAAPSVPHTNPVMGGGGDPLSSMLAAATKTPGPGQPLNAPSMNPTQPVTAGLASGIGPGPEALGMKPPSAAEFLYRLAMATGDKELAAMADEASGVGL